MQYELRPPARLKPESLAALGVAVASFIVSCIGYGFVGLMIAFAAMLVGVIAFFRAHAHGVRDAGICLIAIALGVFDLVPAIAVMIAHTVRHT
jgi:exosortase/archaeosortase